MYNFKKISITTIIVYLISTSCSFANVTSGNYLEIDVIRMNVSHDALVAPEVFSSSGLVMEDNQVSNSGNGYGLSYKYAISMEEYLVEPLGYMFIAPGLFYEDHNTDTLDSYQNKFSITSRYGVKLDIGVDFDYNISAYFTNGVSFTKYDIEWVNLQNLIVSDTGILYSTVDSETPRTSISGTDLAYFYGLGVTYSPLEKLSFLLEYSLQSNSLDAKADGYETSGIIFNSDSTESSFIKFGIAYRF